MLLLLAAAARCYATGCAPLLYYCTTTVPLHHQYWSRTVAKRCYTWTPLGPIQSVSSRLWARHPTMTVQPMEGETPFAFILCCLMMRRSGACQQPVHKQCHCHTPCCGVGGLFWMKLVTPSTPHRSLYWNWSFC